MKIPIYQVDAFTNHLFSGNPAAVCIFDHWPPDELMQSIAAENNLAETAFIVRVKSDFEIRWFTPTIEVDLCGHATLASAHVVFEQMDYPEDTIIFKSRKSGTLRVQRNNDLLTLDFPADTINQVDVPTGLANALKVDIQQVYKGKSDYMVILQSEDEVMACKPDMVELEKINARGVIITAPGKQVDFVSRWFGPQTGVPEDPVTGSAHTTLTVYWSQRLNKTLLSARQLSKRGGELACRLEQDRVKISGMTKLYLEGIINIL